MKKFALALMTFAVAVFGFGVVAQAQYGSTPAVEVPASVTPGGTFSLNIAGCTPGETLTVTFNGATTTASCVASATLGSFVAQALVAQVGAGGATVTLTAPTVPGTYPGTVAGNQGFSQTFQVVVAAAATPPGGLPATGSGGIDTTMMVGAGLFAVGLGLFAVTQFRRRSAPVVA